MIGFQNAHCDTPVELSSKIDEEEDRKMPRLKWDPRLECFLVNGAKPL